MLCRPGMSEETREFALLCPHCGEQNPPEFPACWSCHGDLPSAPRVAAAATEGRSALDPTARVQRRRYVAIETAVALIVLWLPLLAGGLLGSEPLVPEWRDRLWPFVLATTYLALIGYFAWLTGDWRRELGLRRPRIGAELLCGAGIGAALLVASGLGGVLAARMGFRLDDSSPTVWEPSALLPLDFLAWALIEEAFYRAYLWRRFTELSGRPALSIVLCALLFSVAHGSPAAPTIGIFLGGLFLGWVFWIRRSLWCLVLGHWLFNMYISFR